jgi:hypothetical protein
MTPPVPTPQDDYLAHIADLIEGRGWAVQGVAGRSMQDSFSYTVGLTAKDRPELWCATLHPKQATLLLNALGDKALEAPLPVGVDIDIDWSVPVRLRGPVAVDEAEVFVASSIYPDHPVTVMQVLWPDSHGVFPDEDGYDRARYPQRVLPLAGEGVAE